MFDEVCNKLEEMLFDLDVCFEFVGTDEQINCYVGLCGVSFYKGKEIQITYESDKPDVYQLVVFDREVWNKEESKMYGDTDKSYSHECERKTISGVRHYILKHLDLK